MSDERDPGLGAALADLPVPEHREGFWDDVRTRVTAEARLRRGVRGFRRSPLGRLGPLLLAVVAVVVILVVVVRNDSGERHAVTDDRRDPATGAAVPQMVTGTVTIDAGATPQRWEVARAIDGSASAHADRTGATSAYDATTGRSITIDDDGVRVDTGVAPGAPDPVSKTFAVNRDLEQHVVAAALSGDDRIDDVEIDGRPAWRYRGPVPQAAGGSGVDEIDATVDAVTGVMRRLVGRVDGRVALRFTMDDFDVHDIADRGRFAPEPPAGRPVQTTDHGFARTTLDDLIPLGVIRPLGARDEVAGYHLDSVWARPGDGDRTGPNRQNPPSRDVVALRYRNGWRAVNVTLRRLVEPPARWQDPFRIQGVTYGRETPITLAADGAFPGAKGTLVIDPQTVPHLWATSCAGDCGDPASSGYVLTAAGAASSRDLRALAEVARAA